MRPNKFPKKDLLFHEYLPEYWWIKVLGQSLVLAAMLFLAMLNGKNFSIPVLIGGFIFFAVISIFTNRGTALHIHVYPESLFLTYHLSGGSHNVWVSREIKISDIKKIEIVEYTKEKFGARKIHAQSGTECFVSNPNRGLLLQLKIGLSIFFSTSQPEEIVQLLKK